MSLSGNSSSAVEAGIVEQYLYEFVRAAIAAGISASELATRCQMGTHYHATASPSTAENTAAGYPNGSLWFEADAHKIWVKDSESGGSATWRYASTT